MEQGVLEVADEVHRVLDLVFEILGKGPVSQAEEGAQGVEPTVELEADLVGQITQHGEPALVFHHQVEFVPVDHEETPAVGGDVFGAPCDFDVAEMVSVEFVEEFVVIAGDVADPGFLGHLEDFPENLVVGLRPARPAFELPAVDDVAHQEEVFTFDGGEEGCEKFGLTPATARDACPR